MDNARTNTLGLRATPTSHTRRAGSLAGLTSEINYRVGPACRATSSTGRRFLTVLVGLVLVLVAMIVRDPVGAADVVERVGAFCGQMLDALSAFGWALSN